MQRDTAPVLAADAVQTMHEPEGPTAYACGFALAETDWSDGPALGHHGSSSRWHATIWVAPRAGVALLATCNQGGEAGEAACSATIEALTARIRDQKKPR